MNEASAKTAGCGLRLLFLLCLPLALASCQTNEDPREGGFVDGVVGITSGGYDDYVEEKQETLEAERQESSTLAARAAAIEAEQAAVTRELTAAEQRLAGLRQQLAGLRQRLVDSTTAGAAERERLKQAEETATRADQGLQALRRDETASLATQKSKIKDLRALIGTVATMVEELSG